MARVNIPDADALAWKDFGDQNSVQVRVSLPAAEANDLRKGSEVEVTHMGEKAKGRIVSDPLAIEDRNSEGNKMLSLIIEKA